MRSWNGSPTEGPERQAYINGYIRARVETRKWQESSDAAARSRAVQKALLFIIPEQVRKLNILLRFAGWPRVQQLVLWLLFDKATARLLRKEFAWK